MVFEEGSSLRGKTITSLLWRLLERGGVSVVQIIVQIVLARMLCPEDFGALAIILVLVNLCSVLVQSGFGTAIVQAPRVDDDDCSTVFWISAAIAVVLVCIVFFMSPAISEFYGMSQLVWPIRLMSLTLLVNAYNSVQVAITQRRMEFRKLTKASLSAAGISGALGIAAAVAGAGLWALVAQQIVYTGACCIILACQVAWFPRLVFKVRSAKKLFGFGWKLLASSLLDQGYQSLSDLVIGKRFGALDLGLVSQGKRYPQALGSLLDGAIQPVMLSAVSRVQDDVVCVKRFVRRALKTSSYLVMPSMTAFGVVAEPVVCLLLGEEWLPCVPFLRMYCFVYALLPIHTTNLQAINGMGRSDLFLLLEVIKKTYGVALLLVAAFVFRDVYIMVGTYVLTGIVGTFVNAWPNRKLIDYSYAEQIRDIGPAFALSAVAGAVAWPVAAFSLPHAMTVVVQICLMAAVYLGLSKLCRVEALSYLVDVLKDLRSRL